MKNYIHLLTVLFLLMFINSCDNALNIKPVNILDNERVFQSKTLLTSYVGSLYDAIPLDGFDNNNSIMRLAGSTDEAYGGIGGASQWWGYNHIRRVNNLIKELPNANIDEDAKTQFMGEAKFIRAYYYFSMVKRYGGVPIIKKPQEYKPGEGTDKFQVPRNTEKEVYDFIAADLDEAASLLPETNDKGRATKYAALTLKSRVMLYAASSAQYAPVGLNGIVGIPSSAADNYWQAAFDAAKSVINSGQYSLYQSNPDKATNFQQLFLDIPNSETIFVRYYSYPKKTHNYDRNVIPFGVRGPDGYGSQGNPTLRFIEQYERVDGSPGTLKIGTPSDPTYYTNATDLFSGYDPRLTGTVIVPFSKWRGNTIHIQAGLYDQGKKVEAGDPDVLYNPNTHEIDNKNGTLHVVGLSGYGGSEKTQTGFYTRKHLDNSLEQSRVRTNGSSTAWVAIRYAEVLLNYAEAAVEMGNITEAKEKINMIRSRAGISMLKEADISVKRVRHERLVELAFEGQRWWDYKRWRTADKIFNNLPIKSLRPFYDIQGDAYRFEAINIPQAYKTFNVRQYYLPIPSDEINKNPKLVQNPNY